MTEINSYANETEAYIDKGLLESHGIKAYVEQNALSLIFPAPGSGSGSIILYVPDNQAAEARKILFDRK